MLFDETVRVRPSRELEAAIRTSVTTPAATATAAATTAMATAAARAEIITRPLERMLFAEIHY